MQTPHFTRGYILSIVVGSPFQILSKYFIERLSENVAEYKEELYK